MVTSQGDGWGSGGDSEGSRSWWVIIGHTELNTARRYLGHPQTLPCSATAFSSQLHSYTPPTWPCLQRSGCQGEAPGVSHPSAI